MSSGTGTAFVIINAQSILAGKVYGNGDDCYLFGDGVGVPGHHFANTTAFTNDPPLNMRGYNRVGLQLITEDDEGQTLTGAWTIEVSNDYVPAGNGSYGQSPGAGKRTDITAAFEPTIEAVTGASNQFVQADLSVRAIRATFTPTA
jgi:hypothetical protein